MTVTRLLPAKRAVTGSGPASIALGGRPHPVRVGGPRETQASSTGDPRVGHGRAVAAQPLRRGVDARLVADEADPAVAVRDQVGDAVARAPPKLSDEDHVRVDPARRTVHEHGGDAGLDLGLQIAVVVARPGSR